MYIKERVQNTVHLNSNLMNSFLLLTSRCQHCHRFQRHLKLFFKLSLSCDIPCVGAAAAPASCCVCQRNQGSKTMCSQCDRPACSSCTRECSSCSSLCCSVCSITEWVRTGWLFSNKLCKMSHFSKETLQWNFLLPSVCVWVSSK